MIGASSSGGGFRALGSYLAQKDPSRVGWVETRNLEGRDVDGVVTEMEEWAGQSERVKRPVYHVTIAFDPDDRPTEAELRESAVRTLRDLGLSEHQALVVRHTDRAHAHVHVMVNRVGPDGKAWSRSHDRPRLRASMEAQERELGVRWTGKNAERVAETARSLGRTGAEPGGRPGARSVEPARDRGFASEIRGRALGDLKGASSWADLDGRLAAYGYRVEQRGQGAVVTDGEREAKLSSVSRSVSRGRLEARLGPMAARSRIEGRAGVGRAAMASPPPSVTRRLSGRRGAARARLAEPRRTTRRATRGAGRVGRALSGGDREEKDPTGQALARAGRLAARAAIRPSLAARRSSAAQGLAGGRPAADGVSGPPMSRARLVGLVRARQTARVDRVVRLIGLARAEERRGEMLSQTAGYGGAVGSTARLTQVAVEDARALDAALVKVYRDPARARDRLLRYAETAGPEATVQRLVRDPSRFGTVAARSPEPTLLGRLRGRAPAQASEVAVWTEQAAPLVVRAHRTRTAAVEAIDRLGAGARGLGGYDGGALGRAVTTRTTRLQAGRTALLQVPGRSPSAALSAAVQRLSPAEKARVVERVGQVGLGAVSRSVAAARALSRGLER